MTRDRVIGKGDGLPWHIPVEYQQFLDHVRGQAVVFGRKSYEIFGRDLPDTEMFVVSRSAAHMAGAQTFTAVDAAIDAARRTGKKLFCAGGASIYALTLPIAQAMYLSIIKGDYDGDAHFPEFDLSEWRVTRRDDHAEFEFRVYER